jgi:hypothetical protein
MGLCRPPLNSAACNSLYYQGFSPDGNTRSYRFSGGVSARFFFHIKTFPLLFLLLTAAFFAGCNNYNLAVEDFFGGNQGSGTGTGGGPESLWARSVVAGTNFSRFIAVAVDGSGNVYAAGQQTGTGTYDYGNGKTATGTFTNTNVVLVKYNSSGTPQWAKSVETGPSASSFYAVAVDNAGNVYAAGRQTGTGTYNYGNGKTATGTNSTNSVVLVKYNSSGTPQWAKSVETGPSTSSFAAVAADNAGNVYAAGGQDGTGTYDYGNGKTATGTSVSNVVLVKYNSSGISQWAKTVETGTSTSSFAAVAADNAGNVYAAGSQSGAGTYNYGNGKTATGTYSVSNVVLVKYNSSGTPQWAKSVETGPNISSFAAVAVDNAGNVYAAGRQDGTGTFNYGNGATATGTSTLNVVLVKYNSSGIPQWAKSVETGPGTSTFYAVAVSGSGYVYAAGGQGGGSFDYGEGRTAQGTYSDNVVLVKYRRD